MKSTNPDVNMVSAPVIAKDRGIRISTTRQDQSGAFEGYIKVTVVTDTRERSSPHGSSPTASPGSSRSEGINIDAENRPPHGLHHQQGTVPGIIGALGQTMGSNGVNIANFTSARKEAKGQINRAPLRR